MSAIRRCAVLFAIALPATGCAAVLGLDTGHNLGDDAGSDSADAAGDASIAAPLDGAGPADAATGAPEAAPPLTCAGGTADCNGIAADGCEANLDDPAHCGSCRNVCPVSTLCMTERCCLAEHATCSNGSQCCSGNCGPGGSGCKK